MNANLIKTAAFVAFASVAVMSPSLAFAGFLSDVAHVVTHPAATVKDVSHAVGKVAKDVAHPNRLVNDAKQIKVGKIVKGIGDDVGRVYSAAAKVATHIPVAKDFAPLARDFGRATRSAEGRWAGAAGAALAVATGGASYAATQAGGWAYAAYRGRKAGQWAQTKGAAWAKAQAKELKSY